ncbi:MAG: hypothetical protein LAP61_24105 [Acidobacteriia bacterium]|nr:hypothetical protein [Terriglobia bacterium]
MGQLPARDAIEDFLKTAAQPALIEPGEDPLPVHPDKFVLGSRGDACTLECWDESRNLVRRIRAVGKARRGFLELEVERFGGRTGSLLMIDLAQASNTSATRHGARLKYREQFRMSLRRQYSGWKLVELSTEPDLHHSLSPAYPRALLRRGNQAIAAIGAGEDAVDVDGVLSFGLIWLDYLRGRETRLSVGTLAIFVPIGSENTTCHRVRYLNRDAARYRVFVHGAGILEEPVEPGDYTNFSTRLDPFCAPSLNNESDPELATWVDRLGAIDGVERRPRPDGSVSLAVRGLEFARTSGSTLLFGIDEHHVAGARQLPEIENLARGLVRLRGAAAPDRTNPLYKRHPEAWLESQVRASPSRLDASIRDTPLYGQAPQFAAGSRGILDLLAVDYDGRLVVIEVKASEDIHLPLQALDYWMRVKWHLERGDFEGRGYFPGIPLRADPPRLLLVAPALEFHTANETVLRYFSTDVQVERVGVGIQWRQELRIMFRAP